MPLYAGHNGFMYNNVVKYVFGIRCMSSSASAIDMRFACVICVLMCYISFMQQALLGNAYSVTAIVQVWFIGERFYMAVFSAIVFAIDCTMKDTASKFATCHVS